MMDLLPIRELLRERSSPGATHWGECWRTHVDCAAQLLLSEVERLKAERDRLADGIRRMAARRCLCHGHSRTPGHGGPCCGVAGGRCVTCDARSLLDVAGDDALDEIVRVSEEAGLYDDPPVPYRALEGSEGGEVRRDG